MQLGGLLFNPVKAAKQLVERSEWEKLLALDEQRHLLSLDSRTVTSVLVAALELGNKEAIDKVVSFCLTKPVDTQLMLGAATRLLTWGYPNEAWSLLSVVEPPATPRQYVALCHRVSMKSKDEAVREAARARFTALVGGPQAMPDEGGEAPAVKSLVPANLAEHQFPASDRVPYTPGTLDVIEGGDVAPIHREADLALLRKFEGAVAKVRDPQVYRFDDVFVNRFGQMWRRNGDVILNSNRPMPTLFGAPDLVEFDKAVLCTNATRGFFHWYAERLPSLSWLLAAEDFDAPVLFGDHAGKFQDDTMVLLGDGAPAFARVGDIAYCRSVYVAQNSLAGLSDWGRFGFIYDRLAASAAALDDRRFANAIYISRRDTNRRVMENEEELEGRLTAMGVACLSFSDLSLAQQINCVQGTKVLIGAHGAGLTHIIGAKPGISVVEIMPSQPGYHSLRFNYARISHVRGHRHTLWLEPINPVSRRWAVELPTLCKLLEATLGKAA